MSSAGVGGLSAPPDGLLAYYVNTMSLTTFWPLLHGRQQYPVNITNVYNHF